MGQDITAPYAEYKLEKKWVEQIFDPRKERGRLERFQDCASHIIFHHCKDKSHYNRLHAANFCRDRMCLMCQWRKSLRTYANISKAVDQILTTNKQKPQFILLTLTVKNCEVAKYAVKPNVMKQTGNVEMKLNALKALKEHLKGVHLQQAGGSLWFALKATGAVLEDDYENLSDDLVDGVDCPVCMEELIRSWYKWAGKEYQLRRTANLGYLWSRDYKIICEDHKIYDSELIEHFNEDIPYGKNVPGARYAKKADHKATFQHQGDVSQRSQKRSVGRSDPTPADSQESLFPRHTITKKIRLPSSPGKSSIEFSID